MASAPFLIRSRRAEVSREGAPSRLHGTFARDKSLHCGQWPRPGSSVRSDLQITQVDANHWLGIVQRHERGNPGPDSPTWSPAALVTQAAHEAVPQPGDLLIVHAHPGGALGEPVTRQGRNDDAT